MLLLCTCRSVLPYPGLLVVNERRLPPLQTKTVYEIFSGLIHAAYFWTTHPTPAGSLLNPSFLSLPRCQGFHPGQWDRCQPHASTQCHKHTAAEGNAIHSHKLRLQSTLPNLYQLHPVMHRFFVTGFIPLYFQIAYFITIIRSVMTVERASEASTMKMTCLQYIFKTGPVIRATILYS